MILETEIDSQAVILISVASVLIGVLGGIFCVFVVLYLQIYRHFRLLLLHSSALLISTIAQLALWPALVTTATANEQTQEAACFYAKIVEIGFWSMSNISSSAMVLWYMEVNRTMSGSSSNTLSRINKKTTIYFCVFACVAIVTYSILLYDHVGTFNGPIYCYIIGRTTGVLGILVLDVTLFYVPMYVPLLLGIIWFVLARTKWIPPHNDASIAENVNKRMYLLFYYLNWSFIVSQVPELVCDSIILNAFPGQLQGLATLSAHLASLQNVYDGLALYYIFIRAPTRWAQQELKPTPTSSSAEQKTVDTESSTPDELRKWSSHHDASSEKNEETAQLYLGETITTDEYTTKYSSCAEMARSRTSSADSNDLRETLLEQWS